MLELTVRVCLSKHVCVLHACGIFRIGVCAFAHVCVHFFCVCVCVCVCLFACERGRLRARACVRVWDQGTPHGATFDHLWVELVVMVEQEGVKCCSPHDSSARPRYGFFILSVMRQWQHSSSLGGGADERRLDQVMDDS